MHQEVCVQALRIVASKEIQHETITCSRTQVSVLPDGTKIVRNDGGDIIFAQYLSGVRVIRYENYVLCTNEAGEHWFGDKQNKWFKMD